MQKDIPILDIAKSIAGLDTDYKRVANLGNWLMKVFNLAGKLKYAYEYDMEKNVSKRLPIEKFYDVIEKEYVKIYKRARNNAIDLEIDYDDEKVTKEDHKIEKLQRQKQKELAAIALWGSFVALCFRSEKPMKLDAFKIIYYPKFDELYPGVKFSVFYYEIMAFWSAMNGKVKATKWYTKKALSKHKKRKGEKYKEIHQAFLDSFSEIQSVYKVTPTALLYEKGRELNKNEESILEVYKKAEVEYKNEIRSELLDNYFVPLFTVDPNRII